MFKSKLKSFLVLYLLLIFLNWSKAQEIDVKPYYQLAEFTIGRDLTPNEKRLIYQEIYNLYKQSPQAYYSDVKSISKALKKLERVKNNPAMVAAAQDELVASFYWERQRNPNINSNLMKIVLRSVPVIAANPNTGVVITKRDIDGFLSMDRFVSKLANKRPTFYTRRDKQLLIEAVKLWTQQGNPSAQQFSQMNVVWVSVKNAWEKLTPKQKSIFIKKYRLSIKKQTPDYIRNYTKPMSKDELGAKLSEMNLYSNIFIQNMNNLAK